MIVILMKDVKGSGKAGDVVKVSDGYARNMLLPKGLAKEATEGNIRSLEKQKAIAAEKLEEQKAAAKEMAAKLEKITLKIESKGGDSGKLFGSITSKDIAEALEKQEGMKIDKKKIEMKTPIKQAGETEVTLKLFTEISAQLKVSVTIAYGKITGGDFADRREYICKEEYLHTVRRQRNLYWGLPCFPRMHFLT